MGLRRPSYARESQWAVRSDLDVKLDKVPSGCYGRTRIGGPMDRKRLSPCGRVDGLADGATITFEDQLHPVK
jgi:hypothetical protein